MDAHRGHNGANTDTNIHHFFNILHGLFQTRVSTVNNRVRNGRMSVTINRHFLFPMSVNARGDVVFLPPRFGTPSAMRRMPNAIEAMECNINQLGPQEFSRLFKRYVLYTIHANRQHIAEYYNRRNVARHVGQNVEVNMQNANDVNPQRN